MKKLIFCLAIVFSSLAISAKPDINVSGGAGGRSNKTVEELCQPAKAQSDLNINNVRATILGGGDMWWDLNTARYEVPKGGGKHSMFAGALWLGGLDEGNQLKLAAMTYRSRGSDYWPGPLSTDGLASVDKSVCDKYDRHWIITREEVETHRAWLLCKNDVDCDAATKFPGYEGSIPDIILNWPAHGAEGELPYALAPFIDLDGDQFYDPLEDYPAYDLDRAFDCRRKETDVLYGDQTIWWVFNDRGNVHTETNAGALGFEIRAQAFAFSTNDEINNMTFNNYRIINKSTFRLTNTYFSTWFDPDLGNYLDDIIGCDIPRGLGYCYNADLNDEGPLGYGLNPPAVGFDFFQGPFADYFDGLDNDRDGCVDGVRDDNGDCVAENPVTGVNERIIMSGFMYYNNTGSAFSGNPNTSAEFYNFMQSRWKNGNPLVVETPSGPGNPANGDGFTANGQGLSTLFAYPGNTFDIDITQAAVETFNKAGALLKKEGITLAYHAHGYEFRPHEYGTLFDYMARNATDFKFELDVFWVQHGGVNPIELMNKYPDFVVLMHLKDMAHGVKGNNTGKEDVEKNVILGQGQIDIAGIVKRARELGVQYMFIEDESSRVISQVPKSYDFLKSLQ